MNNYIKRFKYRLNPLCFPSVTFRILLNKIVNHCFVIDIFSFVSLGCFLTDKCAMLSLINEINKNKWLLYKYSQETV